MLRQINKFTVHSSQFTVGLCILSGIISALPFANGKLWFFSWVGYIPLFIALKNKSKFQAFLLSYLTGTIFWLGTIYWLVHVTLPGMILLALYLALYFAIFGFFYSLLITQYSIPSIIFIPSIWVLLEYLRSHLLTGFPWALLGYSQYLNLPVIQIADITGVWGVSFLIMMINVAVYSFCAMRLAPCARRKKYMLLSIFCIVVTLCYGYYRLFPITRNAQRTTLKVSVIQGNIPQEMKWDPKAKEYIVDKYLDISRRALKDNPDLIVWPEASLPVVLEEEPAFFENIKGFAKETDTPLLLGGVTSNGGLYYNSALLVSGKGTLLNKYDKLHLVPFGEYIPLRKNLSFLETVVPIGDFAAGKEFTVFNLSAIPASPAGGRYPLSANFSVLICFEDLFPGLARDFVKKGAHLLVNITNDAWFGKTSAAYQHLSASVFRAVENRVSLLRSANTGVSCFISSMGKIIARVADKSGQDTFIDGYNTQDIFILKRPTPIYTRYGDIFITGCFLLALYGIILSLRKNSEL